MPGSTANDYAAANIGQVKNIAAKACAEMNAKLPGGAGQIVNDLVTAWSLPPAQGVVRSDHAAINQGQLKALAKPFYDRLAQVYYQGPPLTLGHVYPWTETRDDDASFALVNIGQVKFIFSFSATATEINDIDEDADGLPDWWENYYFGSLTAQGATGDPDSDGVNNLSEFHHGRNPTRGAAQDDTGVVNLRIFLPAG